MTDKITMTYTYNSSKAVAGDASKGIKAHLSSFQKTTDVDVYAFDAVGNTALCWLNTPITAESKILSTDENENVLSVEVATLSGWVNIGVRQLQPK